jgi:transmembrane sensor
MVTKDFLADPKFVKWVNYPDKESDAYWKNWMASHPEYLSELKLARELLLRVRYREIEPRTGAKERVLANILNAPLAGPEASRQPGRRAVGLWEKLGQLTRIAAILTLAFLLSWLAYSPDEIPALHASGDELPMIHKSTAPGEKLQFTLPDGTRVWLNAVSELEFPVKFGSGDRLVKLSGEAFFDVERDPDRPFKVVAEGTVTTALGTSFNINTKTSGGVNISLFTGKVKVEAPWVAEGVFLEPGRELQYHRKEERVTVSGFDLKQVKGWKEGRLIFSEASLPEAVRMLEEWYGVTISLHREGEVEWRYSGEYQNQPLDNVLNSMAYIQKFKYTIAGNKVEFNF